jgi:hypothetical protein
MVLLMNDLPKTRESLSANGLFEVVRRGFSQIPDWREEIRGISLTDALMSSFAMFSLKYPSLLFFDKNRDNPNLQNIYGISQVPSDTHMRTILDEVNPEDVRILFKDVFRKLQRGKALEQFLFIDDSYLLSLDGTGYFASKDIHCSSCLEKKSKKTGEISYSHQMLGASIVHPDIKEVIPVAPEPIIKQDGETKNDCERNAAKRFLANFRKDHPHLKVTILEDALSANAPHIHELIRHDMHYVLGVKEGDHKFLFDHINQSQQAQTCEIKSEDKKNTIHKFRFHNSVPLNESNQGLLVNFIEYWEVTDKKTQHFSWVTDFTVTKKNVFKIMSAGRARWKIENETFNTLKNQEYQFEHNFGHGHKNLSVVFAMILMLAFLVDQVQQLCCPLFQAIWEKMGSKNKLWFRIRSMFDDFIVESMQQLYQALLRFKQQQLNFDSS